MCLSLDFEHALSSVCLLFGGLLDGLEASSLGANQNIKDFDHILLIKVQRNFILSAWDELELRHALSHPGEVRGQLLMLGQRVQQADQVIDLLGLEPDAVGIHGHTVDNAAI